VYAFGMNMFYVAANNPNFDRSVVKSRLAYTQKSEGQNLPERPAFALRAAARRAILPLSVGCL